MKKEKSDFGSLEVERDEEGVLKRFQDIQLRKMLKNRYKGGWRGVPLHLLRDRLSDEIMEVDKAVENFNIRKYELINSLDFDVDKQIEAEQDLRRSIRHLAEECADAANFLLFIADVAGGLDD